MSENKLRAQILGEQTMNTFIYDIDVTNSKISRHFKLQEANIEQHLELNNDTHTLIHNNVYI